MSVSKWAYNPRVCDGGYCVGECDLCPKMEEALAENEEQNEDELQEILSARRGEE